MWFSYSTLCQTSRMISRLLAWNYVNTLSRNGAYLHVLRHLAGCIHFYDLDYYCLMLLLHMMIQMIEHFSMHVNTFEKKKLWNWSRQKLHKILDTTSRFVVCLSTLFQKTPTNSNHLLLGCLIFTFHERRRSCMHFGLWLTLHSKN